jgi:hypothetical protein
MEKSWLYFLMLVVAYELDGRYSHGVPAINVNVENAADYTIQLSKEVTWNDAMHMIDSLNKTIK